MLLWEELIFDKIWGGTDIRLPLEIHTSAKKSAIGVRVEAHANLNGKSLGSVRGRQATVDECSDWQRALSDN